VNTGQVVQIDAVNLPYIGTAPDRGYIEYDDGGAGTITHGTVTLGTSPVVDANSFYVSANVTADGGGTISERGICWNTSATPTTANSKVTNGGGIGAFNTYYEPLASNTTYYLRAYCTNQTGTAYSNEVTITTDLVTPVVAATSTIDGVYFVSSHEIYLSTTALTDGGGVISERGIVYSLTENPTTASTKISNGSGLGAFVTNIYNLTPSTIYYFRSYTINEAGTSYSTQLLVNTTDPVIVVSGKYIKYNGKIPKY
jgi:hypothetical protein